MLLSLAKNDQDNPASEIQIDDDNILFCQWLLTFTTDIGLPSSGGHEALWNNECGENIPL